jgi:membrane protein DedA with SNARE-associated domain
MSSAKVGRFASTWRVVPADQKTEGVTVPDWEALSVYLGVFAALVAAGVGFPMPEELPIVTAGALAGQAAADPNSSLCWWLLLPLCILGVVISDGLLYAIGRVWGVRVLELRLLARILPRDRLERLQERFRRRGVLILLAARLLPGLRSPIFITAGIVRLPWKRFLLADGLYAIPGVSLLFLLAYWFTDEFRDRVVQVEVGIGKVRVVLIAAAVVAVAAYLVKVARSLRERKLQRAERAESPTRGAS